MSQVSVYVWKIGSRMDDGDADLRKLEDFAREKECSYCYEWGEVTKKDETHFTLLKAADGCFEDDELSILLFLTDFKIYCEEHQIKNFTFHFKDENIRAKVQEVLMNNFPINDISQSH